MPKHPRWPWITLIILQLAQVATLLPWLMMAGLAVMAFDAPGSTKMWQPWAFVLAIWSYPLWLLLAAAGSWILFSFRKYWAAVIVAIVFTLPIPILLGVLAVSSVSP